MAREGTTVMLTDPQIDDAIPETIEVQIDDDPDDEFNLAYITVRGPEGELDELFQTRSRPAEAMPSPRRPDVCRSCPRM